MLAISSCRTTCFDEADFSNGSVFGSLLDNSTFRNAKLEGARWKGANLEGAEFDQSVKEEILKMV